MREGVATSPISQCLTTLSIAPAASGGVFYPVNHCRAPASLPSSYPSLPPFPMSGDAAISVLQGSFRSRIH